jgi:hypothetical protein
MIVARSEGPLMTASLPWEQCKKTGKGRECQVRRVRRVRRARVDR